MKSAGWAVGYEIWDLGCGIWDVAFKDAGL
jgi:hypothetical protein